VIRTQGARTRVLVAVLAVAAVVCGAAPAAMPTPLFRVYANLAPVAATKRNGKFNGALAMSGGAMKPSGAVPRTTHHWQLTWKLRLPALGAPAAASLRIRAAKSAAPVTRVLCARCAATAKGMLKVTGSQAVRIANGGAVVVVQTRSARLRGTVKAEAHLPRSSRR